VAWAAHCAAALPRKPDPSPPNRTTGPRKGVAHGYGPRGELAEWPITLLNQGPGAEIVTSALGIGADDAQIGRRPQALMAGARVQHCDVARHRLKDFARGAAEAALHSPRPCPWLCLHLNLVCTSPCCGRLGNSFSSRFSR
jgi:hypothetical protein